MTSFFLHLIGYTVTFGLGAIYSHLLLGTAGHVISEAVCRETVPIFEIIDARLTALEGGAPATGTPGKRAKGLPFAAKDGNYYFDQQELRP